MAAVEIRAVKKFFGATHVVHGVDITTRMVSLSFWLARQGAASPRCYSMIAGLSKSARAIGGRVVNRRPRKSDVAMVFQNYALYPHMTVHDNMFSSGCQG
jgi:ABC-type sugar transport system ATPase subunit